MPLRRIISLFISTVRVIHRREAIGAKSAGRHGERRAHWQPADDACMRVVNTVVIGSARQCTALSGVTINTCGGNADA